MSLKTPVLFIIFNRPDTTIRVFNQIMKAKPRKLYVVADGPRLGNMKDQDLCRKARSVVDNCDWDCKIKKLYFDSNEGCKSAVSTGINWFFENEEMGIILEDDCLPSISFFLYCEKMLNKYKDEENIFSINGCNLGYTGCTNVSYSYTRFVNMWGWATWRRSANKVDYDMLEWTKTKGKYSFLKERLRKKNSRTNDHKWYLHWLLLFNQINKIDTWDYQWIYTCLRENSLCVFPRVNLIKNLGFGKGATHTIDEEVALSNLELNDINFPLISPDLKQIDIVYEESCLKSVWEPVSYRSLLRLFLRGVFKSKKF